MKIKNFIILKKIEFHYWRGKYNLIRFIIYMTIDIHKAIGKLPIIPKRGFTLPNYHYCGPYNPLNLNSPLNKYMTIDIHKAIGK